jgi:hypothetical protein
MATRSGRPPRRSRIIPGASSQRGTGRPPSIERLQADLVREWGCFERSKGWRVAYCETDVLNAAGVLARRLRDLKEADEAALRVRVKRAEEAAETFKRQKLAFQNSTEGRGREPKRGAK